MPTLIIDKLKNICLPLVLVTVTHYVSISQENNSELTPQEVVEDLASLDQYLQKYASYQGRNGFSYREALNSYADALTTETISLNDFGLFLTEIVGKLGDRHASVKGYELPNTQFLPFVVAPLDDHVVALSYDASQETYQLLYPNFPYLTAINSTEINAFLQKIRPRDVEAPPEAYFTRAVKQLKYMEENYAQMRSVLPDTFTFTFSGPIGKDTLVRAPLETVRKKFRTWDEKLFRQYGPLDDEAYNDKQIAQHLFTIDNDRIGYMLIPKMVGEQDAPAVYEALHHFMDSARSTRALIVDVRNNGGGHRALIWELVGYFVHPDSVYVVNVAQQRGERPLNSDRKKDLHYRYLYSFNELNKREQEVVTEFKQSFRPMYALPSDKFSDFHYALFNGRKLSEGKYHYDKPVYILANERSFSAASVLVTTFRGLPNVQLAGVRTDGSSGNSEKFRLLNSGLKIKISTMVSFQKDGRILDGIGTEPDIEIKRNTEHLFWKQDYQLKKLKEIIKTY